MIWKICDLTGKVEVRTRKRFLAVGVQSCQPLCFGRSLLRPRALRYAATLMIISLRSPSEFFLFSIPCVRVGIRFASNRLCVCLFVSEMLVVPQPIGVRVLTIWPIVVFGSIPAFMRHFLARRLPFSIISNRHAETRSWKWAPGWWSLPKNRTPKFLERVLYRTVSVHCPISAERQACEVQHPLLQFLGLFCRPWRNVRRRTKRQLEASHQQRKSDRKYPEDFPLIFMGCDVIWAEMLFTNFFVVHNITLSAADHDICSGAHFRKSELRRRTIYVCYAQNLITTLKIWFCYAKV